MADVLPPIPLPPKLSRAVVEVPPQPSNPPTDDDITRAVYYARDVHNAHGRFELNSRDLSEAFQFQAIVIASKITNLDVAPAWFDAAITRALKPVFDRLDSIETRLDNIEARLDHVKARLARME